MASRKRSRDTKLYCFCRKRYDGEAFMLECVLCENWFHGTCVGILEQEAPSKEWHCDSCKAIIKSNTTTTQDMKQLFLKYMNQNKALEDSLNEANNNLAEKNQELLSIRDDCELMKNEHRGREESLQAALSNAKRNLAEKNEELLSLRDDCELMINEYKGCAESLQAELSEANDNLTARTQEIESLRISNLAEAQEMEERYKRAFELYSSDMDKKLQESCKTIRNLEAQLQGSKKKSKLSLSKK